MQEGLLPERRKAWNAAVKSSLQDQKVWKALRLLLDKGVHCNRILSPMFWSIAD